MLLLRFLGLDCRSFDMKPVRLIGPCEAVPVGCWSINQRCYEWRKYRILSEAQRVFGQRVLAMRWVSDPAYGLGRSTPCILITNHSGFERVQNLLLRIEHGVYS
ncbi:antitoxin Xre/MbcA/ParS toxin-binding domain-containing protein [Pseudomonas guariconensis]|uniref:antitoxin Xre/MbcA/ParS toxin-binding domain-containing protein n=1 Tax=Pseudomonas guariconensis TaxID=1288410 RepID=UPI00397BCBE1